jgi:hypothetical protein
MPGISRKATQLFSISLLIGMLLVAGTARPAAATNAVVGNGTPGSCTEAEFNAKLAIVQSPPDYDGDLSFNCGGPATIIFTSQKVIDTQLIIIDGGGEITLSGGNTTRIFHVVSGTLDLNDITLSNGSAGDGHGGAILAEQNSFVYLTNSVIRRSRTNDYFGGSAILSFDTHPVGPSVQIENSTIEDNIGAYGAINTVGKLVVRNSFFNRNSGGAISVGSTAEISDSLFLENEGRFGGGAILATDTADVTVDGSLMVSNSGSGGAIRNDGHLVLKDTTVRASRNLGGFGGGAILNLGEAYLTGVTISYNIQNSGAGGGAIYNIGRVDAYNSTISHNRGVRGSALYNLGDAYLHNVTIVDNVDAAEALANSAFGDLVLTDSLVLNSAAGVNNCTGENITVANYNLFDDNSCQWTTGTGNIISNDPYIVLPLDDNGGPTRTHMLFSDSPALDAGLCEAGHDQRGVIRPQGPACDIGSVERQPNEFALNYLFIPLATK